MLENKFVKRFEDCVLVEGHSRSAIYDFSRKRYSIIDTQQTKWFKNIDLQPYENVLEKAKENSLYSIFLKFLLDNEYIFICTKTELTLFPPIKEEWHSPFQINNLIMIRNAKSGNSILGYLKELEIQGLKHVQLFLEKDIKFNIIKKLIDNLSEISILSIEIFLEDDLSSEFIENSEALSESQLITITITEKNEFSLIRKSSVLPFNIIYIKNTFQEIFASNSPDPNYFTVDIRLYMESISHNTFFNKKLIINAQDQILTHWEGPALATLGKNTPALSQLIKSSNFTQFWNVKKADIKVCRDCEYRHMCVDSRVPQTKNHEWFFTNECNYDPYTGKWLWEKEIVKNYP